MIRLFIRAVRALPVPGAIIVALVLAVGASAYLTSVGSGAGTASVGNLNPPTSVTVPATSSGTVHVTWNASDITGSAIAPQGYYVEHNNGSTWAAACGSSPGSLVTGVSCNDTVTIDGDYTYRATAVYHSWTASSTSSGLVHVVTDTTPPDVAINQAAGQADPTNASPIDFRAVFSEPINAGSFTSGDVSVTGTAGGTKTVTITQIAPNDGTTFTVAVAGMTSDGSVIASIPAGGVADLAGNTNTVSTSTDHTVTYDTTAPTVSSINRQTGAPNPTNTGPLPFTVTFSEPVNTAAVVAARFAATAPNVTGTAPSVSTITPVSPSGGFATVYTVNVSTAGAVGADNGSVRLDQTSVGTIQDQATNGLTATHNGDQTFSYDTTAPTLTSLTRAGASSTVNGGPLTWTVTFSEPVNGVTTSNFALATSGTAGTAPTITSATASGGAPSATWTISVSTTGTTGTNAGSIGLNLANATNVKDVATNNLATSTFTGQAYTYDTTAPTVSNVTSTLADGSYKAGQVVPVTVTFNEPVTVTGTPQLTLSTGSPATTAVNYTSGSGSATLTFAYTVAASWIVPPFNAREVVVA